MRECFQVAAAVLFFVLIAFMAGCGNPDSSGRTNAPPGSEILRLDLGRKASDELIRYYAGGMLQPPEDPLLSGLIYKDGGSFFLNIDVLRRLNPWAAEQIKSVAGESAEIDWDTFADFLETTHSRLRAQPSSLSQMYLEFDIGEPEDRIHAEVIGVMSTMLRRVSIGRPELVDALRNFSSTGERIIYPVGTAIVAEHYDADSLREVTVMRKREDEQWDFFVYGADGMPARSTLPRPRSLNVPTQCAGCHFGAKLYEPEKSFPSEVPDGPHGPRVLYVRESDKDLDVVRFFDEHRKRSDDVLGLYATIFVSRLRHERATGAIDPDMLSLLNDLGL